MVLDVGPFHAGAATDEAATLEMIGCPQSVAQGEPAHADQRFRNRVHHRVEGDRLFALHLEIEFQMVLQISADARAVDQDWYVQLGEVSTGSDTGTHQQERRRNRASGKYDLAPRPDDAFRPAGAALPVCDPNRTPALEDDP